MKFLPLSLKKYSIVDNFFKSKTFCMNPWNRIINIRAFENRTRKIERVLRIKNAFIRENHLYFIVRIHKSIYQFCYLSVCIVIVIRYFLFRWTRFFALISPYNLSEIFARNSLITFWPLPSNRSTFSVSSKVNNRPRSTTMTAAKIFPTDVEVI